MTCKNNENLIYIGDGFYELETHELSPYRWSSGEFEFLVNNKLVNSIILYIESPENLDITDTIGCKIITKTNSQIQLKVIDRIIKIKCDYFIPKVKYGTNDARKLSYKLYSIKLNNSILSVDSISHIPSKFFKESYGHNTIVNYGEYGEMFVETKNNNSDGKINLNNNQISFYSHRSGWNYVINSLFQLHNDNGVHFDGFLENSFAWRKKELLKHNQLPYKKDWIGIFHNPPNMPSWFSDNGSHANMILSDITFIQSLKFCKGIYVLSKYHAEYLKHFIPEIPINVLYHPTEIPSKLFTYKNFIENEEKRVIMVGWWLRKLNSFFLLKSPYKKTRILPIDKCKIVLDRLQDIEKTIFNIKLTDEEINSVELIEQLTNDEYDDILSKNIMYLNLYDSSANNAIIECIARGTPLLINKLPSIVEYLGEEYPFYFSNEKEAETKLNDLDLIIKTHEYLCNFNNRNLILIDRFMENFKNSSIYKNL